MLGSIKKLKFNFLFLLVIVFSSSSFAANTVIDILVVYTKGTADAYGGDPTTRINQLFQFTNQVYSDSGVNVEIRVANTMIVDYTDDNDGDAALKDITFARDAALKDVATVRDNVKADMVIFYRPFKLIQGSCGQAWIGGLDNDGKFSPAHNKNYMYAHIPINGCGDFVTAHELGHNMGLKHSRLQDGAGSTFPYALGYGVANKFATIMAYQESFNVDYWTGKVYKFSNPELTCKGEPCGVDRNDENNGADATYALNITTPQISDFLGKTSASSESSSSMSSSSSSVPISSVASSSAGSVATLSASSSSEGHVVSATHTMSDDQSSASGGGSIDINFLICLMLLFSPFVFCKTGNHKTVAIPAKSQSRSTDES